MYSFSYLEPVCCSMSSSNCCFLTCIQVSQEVGQVVWHSHLFQNFPKFIVIHSVKGSWFQVSLNDYLSSVTAVALWGVLDCPLVLWASWERKLGNWCATVGGLHAPPLQCDHFSKPLSPNTITLGIRISKYKFWRNKNIQK